MSTVQTLIGSGISPLAAVSINLGNVVTIAAAGSSNTDAALLTGDFNRVTGADGTKGVILPGVEAGGRITVSNESSSALKVYPPSGDQLNGLTATTGSVSIAGNKAGIFINANSTNWAAIYA
jgi:hypothetical protein